MFPFIIDLQIVICSSTLIVLERNYQPEILCVYSHTCQILPIRFHMINYPILLGHNSDHIFNVSFNYKGKVMAVKVYVYKSTGISLRFLK